jgi:hypothetical protein
MKTIITLLFVIACLNAKSQGIEYEIPDEWDRGVNLFKDSTDFNYNKAKTIKAGEHITILSVIFIQDTSVRHACGPCYDYWKVIYKSKPYYIEFNDIKMNQDLLDIREQSLSKLKINSSDISLYEYDPDLSLYSYMPGVGYLPDENKRIQKEAAEKEKEEELYKDIVIGVPSLIILIIVFVYIKKRPKKKQLL